MAAGAAVAGPLDDGIYRPGDAPALLQTRAHQHVCRAVSPVAWGVGYSTSLAQAKRIALVQCALRTPRNMVCVITACT